MKKFSERYLIFVDAEKLFDDNFFERLGQKDRNKEGLNKIAVAVGKNLLEIEKIIHEICKNNFVDFVCMVDTKKDVCYIYKAKGSLNEIKKEALPKLETPFKFITKNEMVFQKIEDLRCLMQFFPSRPSLN